MNRRLRAELSAMVRKLPMLNWKYKTTLTAVLLLAVAGCSSTSTPDFLTLYRNAVNQLTANEGSLCSINDREAATTNFRAENDKILEASGEFWGKNYDVIDYRTPFPDDGHMETTLRMEENNPGLIVLGAFWGKDYGDLVWRISIITGNEVMPSGNRAIIYWVEKRETVWVVVFNKHGCRVDQGPILFKQLDFLIGLDTTEV
jgi:hypothetical protein